MNQEKNLVKKTVIYAIGNIGSKVLAYIMVLLYSHFILSEDMGYYDLILTTVSMVQPIIAFQITDGVYRFLINDKNNKVQILTTAFKFLCITVFFAEIGLGIVAYIYKLEYVIWIGLYLIAILFYCFFHDAVRGLGQSKKYAIIGIINSSILLGSEIVGLLIFNLGILALLAANVISMLACIIIMVIWQKEFRRILYAKFNIGLLRELIRYSAPLVPNTICWWVVNSSDRYIILGILGTAYNGIYSISNKFPTILTTITGIFYLAWQESAIREYNSSNRDEFFSKIFHKYYILLFTLCTCAIPMTHIVIEIFVGSDYKSAWMYSGFLYLGALFSALCSFLGLGYQISKETSRSISTTIIAACINVSVNVSLIKIIGLQAASLSTFIAYFFLFIIRVEHTKKYFSLTIDWKKFYGLLCLCMIMIILTLITKNLVISAVLSVFGVCLAYKKNKELINPIISRLLVTGR